MLLVQNTKRYHNYKMLYLTYYILTYIATNIVNYGLLLTIFYVKHLFFTY